LAATTACAFACGETKDDVATLVWCMGANQLMMGDNELVGLGLATSSRDNGSYFAKSLLTAVWHNSITFSTTLCWSCCR
jgi:hypothetical protein